MFDSPAGFRRVVRRFYVFAALVRTPAAVDTSYLNNTLFRVPFNPFDGVFWTTSVQICFFFSPPPLPGTPSSSPSAPTVVASLPAAPRTPPVPRGSSDTTSRSSTPTRSLTRTPQPPGITGTNSCTASYLHIKMDFINVSAPGPETGGLGEFLYEDRKKKKKLHTFLFGWLGGAIRFIICNQTIRILIFRNWVGTYREFFNWPQFMSLHS